MGGIFLIPGGEVPAIICRAERAAASEDGFVYACAAESGAIWLAQSGEAPPTGSIGPGDRGSGAFATKAAGVYAKEASVAEGGGRGDYMNEGFVYLDEAVPGIMWDAKYASSDNFTGAPVDGYAANRVVGTREMAEGLLRAAEIAEARGLRLLIWDAYRPSRAVARFLRWAAEPEDGLTKREHYPNIDKTDIVPLGYVAERSGHSRGSAVDLTLVDSATGRELDMGGGFDLMDDISHHGAAGVSDEAARNRLLLRGIMEECGFADYECEWWHYKLASEPYPDTYFDFPIY